MRASPLPVAGRCGGDGVTIAPDGSGRIGAVLQRGKAVGIRGGCVLGASRGLLDDLNERLAMRSQRTGGVGIGGISREQRGLASAAAEVDLAPVTMRQGSGIQATPRNRLNAPTPPISTSADAAAHCRIAATGSHSPSGKAAHRRRDSP